jgi:hypothetical protein
VTTGADGGVWHRFAHDPRDPAYAGMRASDRDRAVVHDVLAEAYAEGRLDRDELDERIVAVDSAKTYADLVPPIRDLAADVVPATFSPEAPAVPAAPAELRRSAEQYYRGQLRDSFFGLLIPNLICWAVWFMAGHGGIIWPIFVTIPTLVSFLKFAGNKQRTIDARVEKLQRRQARALEGPAPASEDREDS